MSGERYTKSAKLGSGTYGNVYRAVDNLTKKEVAMKIMTFDPDEGMSVSALREMSIMKSVNHPNIITLYDVIVDKESVIMIMELMGMDLGRYIRQYAKADNDLIRSYSFQLINGIFALHTHRIIHRDLKPGNLLIDKHGHLKITDFGLSRYITYPVRPLTPGVVTRGYRSPEILFMGQSYDFAVDIWSAGVIICEMIKWEPIWCGDSDIEQLDKITEVLGTPTKEDLPDFDRLATEISRLPHRDRVSWRDYLGIEDPLLIDLIAKMLVYDPKKRITAAEARHHPYFEPVRELFS